MLFREKPKDFDPKVEIVSCFVEHGGNFLLLHRCDHKYEGDKWGVPAGKVEKSESIHAALLREVKEETGLDLQIDNVFYKDCLYVRYPDYDFVYHVYHTKLDNCPEIKLSQNEHKDYKWASPEEALKMPLMLDEDLSVKIFYGLS